MLFASLLIVAAGLVLPGLLFAQPQLPPSGPSGGGALPTDTLQPPDTIESLRWGFGPGARLRSDVRADSAWLVAFLDSLYDTDIARMRRNLAIATSDYMPTPLERSTRALETWRSMGMQEIHPNAFVPVFSANLNSIATSLGLAEDVTPRIKYRLDRTSHVSVKIYSMEAEVVATLVDGPQPPGVYDFEWDFLGSDGVRVPYGSYIADVVVDKVLVKRKRILVP